MCRDTSPLMSNDEVRLPATPHTPQLFTCTLCSCLLFASPVVFFFFFLFSRVIIRLREKRKIQIYYEIFRAGGGGQPLYCWWLSNKNVFAAPEQQTLVTGALLNLLTFFSSVIHHRYAAMDTHNAPRPRDVIITSFVSQCIAKTFTLSIYTLLVV